MATNTVSHRTISCPFCGQKGSIQSEKQPGRYASLDVEVLEGEFTASTFMDADVFATCRWCGTHFKT